jgi:hypothetical protein
MLANEACVGGQNRGRFSALLGNGPLTDIMWGVVVWASLVREWLVGMGRGSVVIVPKV